MSEVTLGISRYFDHSEANQKLDLWSNHFHIVIALGEGTVDTSTEIPFNGNYCPSIVATATGFGYI